MPRRRMTTQPSFNVHIHCQKSQISLQQRCSLFTMTLKLAIAQCWMQQRVSTISLPLRLIKSHARKNLKRSVNFQVVLFTIFNRPCIWLLARIFHVVFYLWGSLIFNSNFIKPNYMSVRQRWCGTIKKKKSEKMEMQMILRHGRHILLLHANIIIFATSQKVHYQMCSRITICNALRSLNYASKNLRDYCIVNQHTI